MGEQNRKILRKMFRSILKISRDFDKEPHSKNFLYRNNNFDLMEIPDNAEEHEYYRKIMDKVFHGMGYFYKNETTKLEDIVQEEFRKSYDDVSDTIRIDASLAVLRNFSSIWNMYKQSIKPIITESKKCPVEYPTCDISRLDIEHTDNSSTYLDAIKPGILLVAHPLVHGPFKRSVVLILDHSVTGAYGVVINRFENHNIVSAVKNLPPYVTDSFGLSRISFGGMIRRLQVIHSVPECGGVEIPNCKSVPMFSGGDIKKAVDLVQKDPKLLEKFRFFVGCCVWTPQALMDELEAGFWIPCTASPDTLLELSTQPMPSHKEGEATYSSSIDHSSATDRLILPRRTRHRNDAVEDILWPSVIGSLGGPMGLFATLPPSLDSSVIMPVDW
eukprot:gene11552-24165_t